MRFGNLTDVGRQREHNEDNLLSTLFAFGGGRRRVEYALHVVADGMGGAAAGEVASELTVHMVSTIAYEALLKTHINQDQAWINPGSILRTAVERANQEVFTRAREVPQFMGMGATQTSILICQGKAFIAQVGDSRGYILRGGQLRQITRDHSFVGELLRDGRITEAEARNHPRKNIITRAVGSRPRVQVDLFQERLRAGDILLACSDGLSGMVTDEEMRTILLEGQRSHQDQLTICETLIARANAAGGQDNITVAVIAIEPSDIPAQQMDQVCLMPDKTLTWDEAIRLEIEDNSFVQAE
jgi:serine/threonine protein phosphatase PrpC